MTAVVGDLREQTRAEEFAAVFAEHHQEVRRLAYALCGDWARADDAAAEAFARTWPKWRRGKVDDVRPYLRRTVVNHVRGRWRRRATERREEHHHRGDDRGERSDEDSSDDRGQLTQALLELPPRQRAAVALRYLEDCSVDETAVILAVSAGTVKAQVSRGLARLRELMDDEESAR